MQIHVHVRCIKNIVKKSFNPLGLFFLFRFDEFWVSFITIVIFPVT